MRWSQAHYMLARMFSAGKMLLWVSPGLALLLWPGAESLLPLSVPQLCQGADFSQGEGFPARLACCFWGWQSTLLQPWEVL